MTSQPQDENIIDINIDAPTTEFQVSVIPNIEIDLEPEIVTNKNPEDTNSVAPPPAPAPAPKTDDEKSFALHKELIKCFKQRLGPTIAVVQDFHSGMYPVNFAELPDADIKSMALTPDNKWLFIGTAQGCIQKYDLSDDSLAQDMPEVSGQGVSFLKCTKSFFFAVSKTGELKQFNIEDCSEVNSYPDILGGEQPVGLACTSSSDK
jgi:hypothetical protein